VITGRAVPPKLPPPGAGAGPGTKSASLALFRLRHVDVELAELHLRDLAGRGAAMIL